MKKKALLLIILTLCFTIVFTACDDDSIKEDMMISTADLLGATRDYYVQHIQSFNFDETTRGNFFMHQEQLHRYSLETDMESGDTDFALMTFDADGTNMRELFRAVLDESVDGIRIIGFEKHENGYISLVTHEFTATYPYTRADYFAGEVSVGYIEEKYIYRRISPLGEIISATNIDALNNNNGSRQIVIVEVAFDLDGNAVASGFWWSDDFDFSVAGGLTTEGLSGQSLFIFDSGITGDFHEIDDNTFSVGLFNRTHDGQVIIPTYIIGFPSDTPITMFYEVDFENAAIVEGSKTEEDSSINSISGVFPALETSLFDFYFIGNEWQLFGYRKLDGSTTMLIDFIELGMNPHTQHDRYTFLQWSDGRISIVERSWNAATRQEDINLFLLAPSDEPQSDFDSEPETLILGGIDVTMSPLMAQVARFNRASSTHRIEVVDYTFEDMDRLRTELITGRGPDVFMLSWWGYDLVATLAESLFILDLYEKIDADPVLSREDFFPSILSAWENSRGELVKIAPDFSIQSIIGMSSRFPNAPDNWTYADFISFYQEAREAGYPYPLGQTLDRYLLLAKLLFADDTFFSEQDGVANFDSEAFIEVLNFVKTIPDDQGWNRVLHLTQTGQWDPVSNLLNGEQLLLPFANIIDLMHFRELQARLGGITAFGFPAANTPVHSVQVTWGTALGIRANSPHADAAWEFVRINLLPDTSHDGNIFPMRIDLFEQLIYDELVRAEPTTVVVDGNEHEIPPMTNADAELLRELIANIGHKPVVEHPVQHIINEDVAAFFAGIRTAEDTARIIQSRVQTFLAEGKR